MLRKIAAALLVLSLSCSAVFAQSPRASCPTNIAACIYKHITTNATTTVKSGAGFVHSITINTKGASANTLTIYDSLTGTGTVISVVDTTASVQTILLDVGFATGLTIVTGTGTAGDITVSYI